MRILYLSARLPFPPNRGDRISTFNHIRYLSQRNEVFVASLIQGREEMEHVGKLRDWANEVVVAHQSKLLSAAGMLYAFLSGKPLSVGNFLNPGLSRSIRTLIREQDIDAVVVHSSCMGQYVDAFPDLIRIMYFADMDSQKWEDMAERAGGLRRWIYRRESKLIRKCERAIAASYTASCVVTENEAILFKQLIPDQQVYVVGNGVDLEKWGQVSRAPAPCELTFVGMMNYEPNIEACAYFVRHIWPEIRKRHPHAVFNIVGGAPTREVKALADIAGVHVTGFVNDVRDYLATSTLVVVPLDIARGLQNKILEAMAAGVPVLTTPASAKGISEAGVDTLYVETRENFADAILRIIQDPGAMKAKAQAAQAFVQAHYSWESKLESLEGLLVGPPKKSFKEKAARLP